MRCGRDSVAVLIMKALTVVFSGAFSKGVLPGVGLPNRPSLHICRKTAMAPLVIAVAALVPPKES